jgi:hypothetical protein
MALTTSATRALLAAAVSALGMSAGSATGQSNDELNGSFQFNFYTPGARSLGVGRAFAARADDATAAYANPAQLLWFHKPEFTGELRNASYDSLYVNGGRVRGAPSTKGIDVHSEPQYGRSARQTTGLNFFSLSYPLRKAAFALYRHELANFRTGIDRSQGVFFSLTRDAKGDGRVNPVQADLVLRIENLGLSVGYPISCNLWAGLGLSRYSFRLDSVWEGFDQASSENPDLVSYGAADFSPERSRGTRLSSGDDTDVALIAGLSWQTCPNVLARPAQEPDRRWSVGLAFRKGPHFRFRSRSWSRARQADGSFFPASPCGQFAQPRAVPCGTLDPTAGGRGTFRVPDIWSLGVTFRPRTRTAASAHPVFNTDPWIFSFEYDRVQYSQMRPSLNVLAIAQQDAVTLDEFSVSDADELHVGLERQVSVPSRGAPRTLSLRTGAWFDPDHQLRYSDEPPLNVVIVASEPRPTNDAVRLAARFPGGEDQWHWTVGVGF